MFLNLNVCRLGTFNIIGAFFISLNNFNVGGAMNHLVFFLLSKKFDKECNIVLQDPCNKDVVLICLEMYFLYFFCIISSRCCTMVNPFKGVKHKPLYLPPLAQNGPVHVTRRTEASFIEAPGP